MEEFFQSVVDEGGEGVILRDPKATDQHGRSPGYLKHKVTAEKTKKEKNLNVIFSFFKKFRDAEAKVVGKVGYQQWECELYVIFSLFSLAPIPIM